MPAYDYRCRTCDTLFEVRRGFDEPVSAAVCPAGHGDTTRVFSAVAVGGRASAAAAPRPAAGGAGAGGGVGGCCGG